MSVCIHKRIYANAHIHTHERTGSHRDRSKDSIKTFLHAEHQLKAFLEGMYRATAAAKQQQQQHGYIMRNYIIFAWFYSANIKLL